MGRRGSKYCEKCGCYVPEGETACVSCGYDPTPKPARADLTLLQICMRETLGRWRSITLLYLWIIRNW